MPKRFLRWWYQIHIDAHTQRARNAPLETVRKQAYRERANTVDKLMRLEGK